MMQIRAAQIRAGSHTCAVVAVEPETLADPVAAAAAAQLFVRIFPGHPLLLAAEGLGGATEYYGRRDIVDAVRKIAPSVIAWREYPVPLAPE